LLIKIGILSTGGMGLTFLFDGNLTLYVLTFQLCAAGGIIISSLIMGKLADKYNRKKIFGVTMILMLVLVPLAPFIANDFPSALVTALLVGLSLGGMSTMTMTFVAGITQENPAATSTHFSIFTSFMNAGSTIGLGIFAVITDELLGSGVAPLDVYVIAFIIAPLLALLSLPFVKRLPARPQIKKEELESST
jgi:MFS family permease